MNTDLKNRSTTQGQQQRQNRPLYFEVPAAKRTAAPFKEILACPNCTKDLDLTSDCEARCPTCGTTYRSALPGQLDLRLKSPKSRNIEFKVGGAFDPAQIIERIGPIPCNPSPEFDYRAVAIPRLLRRGNRLTTAVLSHFPHAKPGGSGRMLDLGCGDHRFKEICAATGFEYVGMDYDGDASILADAHALPFKDASFDFVVSFAVLEHLRHPHVAMQEVVRVMKPGAPFIGSVGFIEPFHLSSYYPMSPLGTWDLLESAGLEIRHLEANNDFPGLRALAEMSLFPHAPQLVADLLVLPVYLLHRLWWKLGYLIDRRPNSSEHMRRINNAGGFRFVCRKI